jgi:hypothetical protein
MIHDKGRLGDAEVGIDRHHDRADPAERQKRDDVIGRVTPHDRDAIAALHALRRESGGGIRGALLHLGPARLLAVEPDQRPVRVPRRAALDHAAERVVVVAVKLQDFERRLPHHDSP